MIMEAEKSHDPPPASWRPRRAGSHLSLKALRTGGLMVKAQSEERSPDSLSQAERANSPFLCLFTLPRPPTHGEMPAHAGEGGPLH